MKTISIITMQFRRKVQHGQKLGRKIGFPTVNLNVGRFAYHHEPGVYACHVIIGDKHYKGALHFGPKLDSRKNALEIHVLNFSQSIYGQWISFEITQKIRPLKSFKSLDELKEQIKKDVEKVAQAAVK